MEPIDVAISKAEYLFFTPRIRKTGQDIKTEIHSKFKDATNVPERKTVQLFLHFLLDLVGTTKIFHLLEHVTGLEVGKSYFIFLLSL